MELKDMTDLINIHDSYKDLNRFADEIYDLMGSAAEEVLMEIGLVDRVIARNSVLYQRDQGDPMFDIEDSEHSAVLNNDSLSAEQRAFRLLGICDEE